jgi:DNA invertase Pin-like site-specific DNA recombinase
MAQKERELISARTKAALAGANARGTVLGGDRGWRPAKGNQCIQLRYMLLMGLPNGLGGPPPA